MLSTVTSMVKKKPTTYSYPRASIVRTCAFFSLFNHIKNDNVDVIFLKKPVSGAENFQDLLTTPNSWSLDHQLK